jgi:hypothetical protein
MKLTTSPSIAEDKNGGAKPLLPIRFNALVID